MPRSKSSEFHEEDAAEAERLAALAQSGLMDSEPEMAYDEITELAAQLCQAPVCMISLIGEGRQWFKSSRGMGCSEISTDHSICMYTIRRREALVVGDLRADERFAANPFVTGGMQIRAYAGIPLAGARGHRIGTLCVLDFVVRNFSELQVRQLRSLAHQVETHIALRQELEEKKRLARDLESSQRRFQVFMDQSPVAAVIKDEDGRMKFYNKALASMYGVSTEEWLGKTDHEIWPAEAADRYRGADLAVLSHGVAVEFEERSPLPDGGFAYWRTCKFGFSDGEGQRFLGAVAINLTHEKVHQVELQSITSQLAAANQQLDRLSRVDALTLTGNRRTFDEQLRSCFEATRLGDGSMSLILIDVDHFKQVNDSHGHVYGDEVLTTMGKLLRDEVRASDHVCRYGGEEFGILLPNTSGRQGWELANRICKRVRRHPWRKGPITASAGIATLHQGNAPADLVSEADQALYVAKRSGRDRAVLGSADKPVPV